MRRHVRSVDTAQTPRHSRPGCPEAQCTHACTSHGHPLTHALSSQSLYGSNIASYYRRDPLGLARARPGQYDSLRDSDRQSASSGSRFFHAANVMLERNRRLRRMQPLVGRKMQTGPGVTGGSVVIWYDGGVSCHRCAVSLLLILCCSIRGLSVFCFMLTSLFWLPSMCFQEYISG